MGRPGSDALPPPTARPLGGLPGPVWGVRGRALSHPRLLALWAGCRGRCGASGVGGSPGPDCPPSGRAAGAGVGRPGSGALPAPTARPLGGLPGPVRGVRGRALSHPRLPALWAGCRGRCGASGVGRSPTPDCPPSGRAAGAGVGHPRSGALPPPTARPLGGLLGPVWGVRGRTLSHPRLPALWAGCRGRCWASGLGRSPTPDCPPSGLAAGAGVGRPGSGALPPPTARPLGGLPGPVWGVRGEALSHPQRPLSGRAAGADVGRPGSDAFPPPTARPLGGLPGPVWGVRGRTLSHPRLPALWAGCRGRCGASGAGRSPTPDCQPAGRAAGAGVGRPGSDALPPPTARPLGGLPGPVWGVRGRTLSHPRLPALWAGCRGRCGASGVGRSPSPDCPPSGRAAGAGVGRPGSDALPPPTARHLGGLQGPVWGVQGRTLSHPRLLALWAGCWGRCGASGVGRSPTHDCPPSGRAAGAGVGRPGSGALPTPTARPLGVLPGPTWGVQGPTLSHPRLPALSAGCRGRCGASWVGRSPTPDCPPSGRAAGAGVGRPGSDALPTPTARPLGVLPGPVWGVQGPTLSHPRLPALWAGRRGRCGASWVGRSPTPDCPPSGRAAGAGVGRPGSDALPTLTARPLGVLPGPVWGVQGPTLSHPRLPALWAGRRGRCGASWVGRSPTPDRPPFGRAAGMLWVCGPAWPGRAGRPPGRVLVRLTFLSAFLASLFACSAPSGLGLPCLWLLLGYFACFPAPGALGLGVLFQPPPMIFFSFFLFVFFAPSPSAPLSPAVRVFRPGLPWALASCCPPPPFFVFLPPPPRCLWRFLLSGCLWPLRPPPFFFPCPAAFFPAARLLCVFWGVVLCVPCPAHSLCCARRLCCSWWLVLLVPGVAPLCWGSAGGSGCPALSFGGVCRPWCPRLVWPSLGVLPVASRSPVLCPVALCCRVVLCCRALSSFFFCFSPCWWRWFSCCSPLVLGSGPVLGGFCFCVLPVRCCAGVPAPLLSVRCSPALAGLAGVLCCCLLCLCVCCWAWLSSVAFWRVLVAPGVVSRWRAVVCPLVLCCAVVLRVVPLGVALLCAVLFRFAPFGAAARCAVSWGAVLRLGVLCLLAPCLVLSPRAVCVLLRCVAAWCCSPLCFVPCAPWGVLLCVSCRLCPVRCCCVARSPSVPCFPVLCPVVLCCRLVPWCPVLPLCWVCLLRGCGCTYLKNRCKIS